MKRLFNQYKYFRYFIYFLSGLVTLILILFIALNIYVSAHKKELIEKATVEISDHISGTIHIDDISVSFFNNFPYLSIQLKNLSVSDSLVAVTKHPLIQAEKIFVRINTFKLFIGEISLNKIEIDNAGFYLFTDSTGYTNGYLLKGKNKPQSKPVEEKAVKNLFDHIELNKVAVTIDDSKKQQLLDFYINQMNVKSQSNDSSLIFNIKNSILIKSLAFNLPKGSFAENHLLEGNFAIAFQPKKNKLSFDSIPISLSKQDFIFNGAFIFGDVQQFDLNIITKNISVDFAKTLLTKKIAKAINIVSVKAPLDVVAHIGGPLKGEPLVRVEWLTKNNSVTTPFINFDSCSFRGSYTNEAVKGLERNDENSRIAVHDFTGKYQDLVLSSDDIIINDLTTPLLSCDLHSSFSMDALNSVLESDAMTLSGGNGTLDIMYDGRIDHITHENTNVSGSIRFEKGNIQMNSSRSTLTDCTAKIEFKDRNISVDTLLCKINGSPIRMWGTAKNTLSLLEEAPRNVELNWNVFAPILNIDHLSSIISRKFPAKQHVAKKNSSGLAKTVHQFDQMLYNGNISVRLNADKLVYHKFEANNLKAAIQITENSWNLNNVSLLYGKGNMSVAAKVVEQTPNVFVLHASIDMKNMDAQKVWYGFDDFGLTMPTSKNLKGILSVHTNINSGLNKSGDFNLNTLNGDADLSIKNGALINFEPVQSLQNFLFKGRDFSNISFAEIKNKFTFKKGEVNISRMEINSSVLSLFLEGVYSTNGKNTDISVQVPLSNLKKRDKEYKPENIGTDKHGGMSVYLRAKTDEDGKIKIRYDPFKRFRKSKAKV